MWVFLSRPRVGIADARFRDRYRLAGGRVGSRGGCRRVGVSRFRVGLAQLQPAVVRSGTPMAGGVGSRPPPRPIRQGVGLAAAARLAIWSSPHQRRRCAPVARAQRAWVAQRARRGLQRGVRVREFSCPSPSPDGAGGSRARRGRGLRPRPDAVAIRKGNKCFVSYRTGSCVFVDGRGVVLIARACCFEYCLRPGSG